jgi:hypothetical protein
VSQAGVITITTRATARRRPTTPSSRHAVAAGTARAVSRATYRRRRILVAVLAVALVLVMAQAGAALGGSSLATPERRPASASASARTSGRSTVVRPGDSLWSVAARLAPGSDPRPVVDALAAARHGTVLVPGETIEWDG